MKIPTIVKSNDGNVFFLQFSKFSHQYDASSQPIYHDTPTLSWHDGFDLSFEFETIMSSLIMSQGEPTTFEICRSESNLDFALGSIVPYFDFCNWIENIDNTVKFNSIDDLFSCFVNKHSIYLADDYKHPSWLTDIFWLLDFNLSTKKSITVEQINTVIRQKRAAY